MKYIFSGLLALLIGISMALPAAVPVRADSSNKNALPYIKNHALLIKVDNPVVVSQPVTITIFSRHSHETIAGATVSAIRTSGILKPVVRPSPIPVENGTATQTVMSRQAPVVIDAEQEDALSGRLGKKEIVLGNSNSAGEVVYTFTDPGTYMLLARKNGYLPGARRINIQSENASKSLGIKANVNFTTGQPSSIQVTEKGSSQPVEGAAVYSLKAENNRTVKQMPPTANNFKAQLIRARNDAARIKENGLLVGYTDSTGQVSYSFPSSGPYLLAAFKDGYTAAVIRVRYLPAVTVPVPTVTTTIE